MEQLTHVFRGLLGIAALLGLSLLFCNNRRAINWRLIGAGLALQIVFAALVLHVGWFKNSMEGLARLFVWVVDFSAEGAGFVFGGLATNRAAFGFIFAFSILPTIIFFSALTSALYYLGVLQKVVYGIAWVLSRTMKLSGAESLSAAANIFVGQTEAPLMVKPYLERMTKSEVLCVMIGGMANTAGGVLAGYIGLLGGASEEAKQFFALHMLIQSIISAPAAIIVAKLLYPQTEEIDRDLNVSREKIGANLIDAICVGTTDGLKLALNVGAMLVAFTALIALCNGAISSTLGNWFGLNGWASSISGGQYPVFNLQFLLGLIGAPFAWLIGVDSGQLFIAGQLLGEKTVLNEFVAYSSMSKLKDSGVLHDPRAILVLTYALSGFSNIVSIGIQVGGISALAPNQRENLARLGWRALLGGSIACFLTACVAGMLT
ncbi:MAG: nucleoside transporter C-terminal domain-containing protein [Nibricoccus sp.]